MTGQPTFLEIGVPDADRASEFYRAVFPDWSFGPKPGGYRIRTEGITAGLHGGDDDRRLVVYLSVPDLDKAVEAVRTQGGQAGDVMDGGAEYGRFAECVDNQGVHFGLHEPPAVTSSE